MRQLPRLNPQLPPLLVLLPKLILFIILLVPVLVIMTILDIIPIHYHCFDHMFLTVQDKMFLQVRIRHEHAPPNLPFNCLDSDHRQPMTYSVFY